MALVDTYPQFPFTLVSGEGARVRDDQGREYWDLYGGHAVALLGHAHPRVTQALQEQAEQLTFYSNATRLHVRTQAAERLAAFAPHGLPRVFFCNSGAEANENALKLAVQQTGRIRIAALEGGFHGRTLLALSASSSEKLRQPYLPLLGPVRHLHPQQMSDVDQIDEETAAVIVEPIQSMAGVVEPSSAFLWALRRRCDAVGALLIYDEVQTGMGRLGRPFAAGEHDVLPDMVTLAKGMANGVPMGAVLMTESVGERVRTGDLGTTFGGGPLACSVLLAVLDTIADENLMERAAEFGTNARDLLKVGPVRQVLGRGCLLGLRLDGDAAQLQRRLFERGFITGTSSDPCVLRILPPLNTPTDALHALSAALCE
ncbi:MAG: aspartate aminotransferase family protein [bacterium]|nr:aspartate aminotransferase family protein [bacterium]